MPELPEVEVLVRHLRPLLVGRIVESVKVLRARFLRPTKVATLKKVLRGSRVVNLTRRGKFLLFGLHTRRGKTRLLLGHLGMTGRMYLQPAGRPLPKHTAVVLGLKDEQFVFEDTRYFGRFTLDTRMIEQLGPEPLSEDFTVAGLAAGLAKSRQPVKVRLLDQSLIAGVGNIYASEALFRAGISPRLPACRLSLAMVRRLWSAVRETLREAIEFGSTAPLDFAGLGDRARLFYYGQAPGNGVREEEKLRVYDRQKKPCVRCTTPIKRIVQAARSTFYCPRCQR